MPEINVKTMCLAIQAVAAEIRTLRKAIADDDFVPEDEQLLEDYKAAAEDLERAYDKAMETVINLPPYDELTRAAPG
jgi:hypothetical protein